MSLVFWIPAKPIDLLPSLFFARSFGKNKKIAIGRIDLSRIPVNKGTNSRLGLTKYSDLDEIVLPSLILIAFCLLI